MRGGPAVDGSTGCRCPPRVDTSHVENLVERDVERHRRSPRWATVRGEGEFLDRLGIPHRHVNDASTHCRGGTFFPSLGLILAY